MCRGHPVDAGGPGCGACGRGGDPPAVNPTASLSTSPAGKRAQGKGLGVGHSGPQGDPVCCPECFPESLLKAERMGGAPRCSRWPGQTRGFWAPFWNPGREQAWKVRGPGKRRRSWVQSLKAWPGPLPSSASSTCRTQETFHPSAQRAALRPVPGCPFFVHRVSRLTQAAVMIDFHTQ